MQGSAAPVKDDEVAGLLGWEPALPLHHVQPLMHLHRYPLGYEGSAAQCHVLRIRWLGSSAMSTGLIWAVWLLENSSRSHKQPGTVPPLIAMQSAKEPV